jgi:hypothetical protein
MTRAQQIAAAVKVLAPVLRTSQDYAAAREVVDDALNIIGVECANAGALRFSKADRRAIATFTATLRRAAVAQRRLPAVMRLFSFRDLDCKALIAEAERWLPSKPARPGRPTAKRAQLAVRWARALLTQYGLPVKTTRGSRWCQLAAILYGDKNRDLFSHMLKSKIGEK